METDYLNEDELHEKYGNPACYNDKDFYMDEKQIVEVHWLDAGLESCHLTLEEARQLKPMPRKNVGYPIKDDSEEVILAFGTIEDTNKSMVVYDQTLVIPRGMVVSTRKLS